MKRVLRENSFFTALTVIAFLLTAIIFTPATAVRAEGQSDGSVVINSPADGAKISGSTVDVVFELQDKGSRGDHVHLYLDGKLVKPLYGKKVSYTIKGIGGGRHSIVIKLATKGHQILDTEDSVTVDVR